MIHFPDRHEMARRARQARADETELQRQERQRRALEREAVERARAKEDAARFAADRMFELQAELLERMGQALYRNDPQAAIYRQLASKAKDAAFDMLDLAPSREGMPF